MTPATIQHQFSLDNHNTMALSCIAKQMVTFTHENQIAPFLTAHWAVQSPAKLLVLSGGSNVLLPRTLNACVLHPLLYGIKCIHEDNDHVYIEAMSGENWHDFVMHCVNHGWYGLENMALIPGMVGAAPVQNIGAYGVELCDVFHELTAIHLHNNQSKTFDKTACQFAYRNSVFKQEPNTWLITKVVFKLNKKPQLKLGYGDVAKLAKELSPNNEATPQAVAQAIIHIRQSKLPNPDDIANTGSFFKNPVVSESVFNTLIKQHPNMPYYPQPNNQVKLAAGWLIDQAGLKGKSLNDIATHSKQALVVINNAPKKSTQADIATFSRYIQDNIQLEYGIMLEREPVWVNQDGSVA